MILIKLLSYFFIIAELNDQENNYLLNINKTYSTEFYYINDNFLFILKIILL